MFVSCFPKEPPGEIRSGRSLVFCVTGIAARILFVAFPIAANQDQGEHPCPPWMKALVTDTYRGREPEEDQVGIAWSIAGSDPSTVAGAPVSLR